MPGDRFAVIDVGGWRWELNEQMGKPGKRWLRRPEDDSLWLWKPVTEQRDRSGTFLKGEDWAEKIASEVARLLGIPAATAELAHTAGQRGVVVRSVLEPDTALVHGNELLERVVPGYPTSQRQETPNYRLETIASALEYAQVSALPPSPGDAMTAFVRYLALDALIANTDRHHTNWGVMRHLDGRMTLAPSFDHATSLGFQFSDHHRTSLLEEDGGIERWAEGGRSRPFEGRPTLTSLLETGVTLRPEAADQILAGLGEMDDDVVAHLVDRIPDHVMSQPARSFVQRLLTTNRRRTLDACHRLLS